MPGVYEPRPQHVIQCVICGVDVLTHFGRSKYCSQRCRNQRPGKNAAIALARAEARAAAPPPPTKPAPSSALRFRDCQQCGGAMVDRNHRKYCSEQCRVDRIAGKLMGLYRASMEVRNITTAMHWHRSLCEYLANRDGPRCGICRKPVDLTLKSGPRGDDAGPSIDHIVPTSKDGTDDLANLRLTHWGCNRTRGNRGDVEQLRLVG